MLTHSAQSMWLPMLGIVSPWLLAILAPFPMHGTYLCDSFPYSVHFPVSVSFHIRVSMWLICLWFVLCYVLSSLVPICFHLDTCLHLCYPHLPDPHMYISLVCHVCLPSLYINFDSTIIVILHLRSTWVFCLSIFLASGNCLTLEPLLFDFTPNQKLFPQYQQHYDFPVTCGKHIHLHIFEIPGLWQKASTVHKLKPLSIPPIASRNLWDPIFALGSLGLICNTKDICLKFRK